ncbi:zf-HC2 domain-containing protein [Edaphobacter modestus]|uniref:Anti-sigma factor RsiW n=1 Tax=Edaphobacter modestus TaxID=388466 RepID=A0A4Q7YX00_9BACT|nr:zf-HC2 domain-containing protein [Edaphobacter modestus]RZU42250.1 anti-sigma factor RsiW [Edaphobacter modestus]
MSDCADYSSQIQLYLDDELNGSDAESLLAHLDHCESCRREMEGAEAFSRRLRQARPFAGAPVALHERIATLVATRDALKPEALIHETKIMVMRPRKKTIQYALAVAAMLFLVASGFFFTPRLRVESNANSFISTAIDSHRALSDAALQLDVQSESPSVVSAWFSQRVSFPFRMPNAGIAANDLAKYKLRGGRLVTFGGERAAVLVFRLSQDLVTVLIAPDRQARAIGGHITYSDGIKFHAMDRDRMHVVTWENQSLTYALTSNLKGSAARACSTCHEGASSKVDTSQFTQWMRKARPLPEGQQIYASKGSSSHSNDFEPY